MGKCREMCQLCRQQTALFRKNLTVDKTDKYSFQMYRTTVKQEALQSLTHNLSSLIECTYVTLHTKTCLTSTKVFFRGFEVTLKPFGNPVSEGLKLWKPFGNALKSF